MDIPVSGTLGRGGQMKGETTSNPNEPPGGESTVPGAPRPAMPESIGVYRILDRLGEGGFGDVYLAEQTKPVRRRVALKIIKLGMDTRQVVARFEAERQALALMDHPNVAKVFDAGATKQGRPYFVMEHVAGMIVEITSSRLEVVP
jgi:serine/threonine protein kinase